MALLSQTLLILRSRGLFTSSTNPLEVLLGRTTWAAASAEEGERVSDIEDEDDLVAIIVKSICNALPGGVAQSI